MTDRRFRPEINVRAPASLLNTVTQGMLEDGHAGVLLDEGMHSFAFACPPGLSSFWIPGLRPPSLRHPLS